MFPSAFARKFAEKQAMEKQSALRFFGETSTEEATIEIYGQIGYEGWDREEEENTARLLAAELDRIKALKAKRITVRINSLGGDVNHALAIHDLLAEHPAHITTQINGLCASAATVIALAGETRKMSRNALFLIHQCSAWVGRANEETLRQEIESQHTVNARLSDIYIQRCGEERRAQIEELISANGGRGRWLDAHQALEAGFITDIYNETKKAASLDGRLFAKMGLPGLPEGYDRVEEDSTGLLRQLLDLFKGFSASVQKTDHNQTPIQMKERYPLLASLCGQAATLDGDGGALLDASQLSAIEQSLGNAAKGEQLLKEAQHSAQQALEEKQTAEKEAERLKAIVDAIPSPLPKVEGRDPEHPAADDMKAYVNSSALYGELKKEI